MSSKPVGRPREHEEVKRSALTIRTTPSIKDAIAAAAERSGRSVTQEIELRLQESLQAEENAGSPETHRLLMSYASDIAAIEKARKKSWHRDLVTWAAVSEALRGGAIKLAQPDRPADDDIVEEAWRKLYEITSKKEELATFLLRNGVPCSPHAPKLAYRYRPMTSDPNESAGDQIARLLVEGDQNRSIEETAIDNLNLSEAEKDKLRAALAQIKKLDDAEVEADREYGEALAPYFEAERQGRQWFHEWRTRQTAEASHRADYRADPRGSVG